MVVRWVAGALVPLALAMSSASGLAAESFKSQAGSIAVVAQEMKSLADTTREEADRIRSLMETLQTLLKAGV